MRQLGVGVRFAEGLNDGVLNHQRLLGVGILLAIGTVAFVTAVIQPEIILSVRRLIIAGNIDGILVHNPHPLFAGRAEVLVLDAIAVGIHTEIFRMRRKVTAGHQMGSHMLLELDGDAGGLALGTEFLPLARGLILSGDAEHIKAVFTGDVEPIHILLGLHVIPSQEKTPLLKVGFSRPLLGCIGRQGFLLFAAGEQQGRQSSKNNNPKICF